MKTILVADDNPLSRELILDILEGSGHRLVEACNGREALHQAAIFKPDLILLDIQMPHTDGYGVLSAIRSDPHLASLRVVALTAFAMDGDRRKASAAGFDAYMTKPIDIDALRALVQSYLG